ncbi:MAG TPA: cytochrome c family protein [Alphaproteobacteria bacterium]
MRSVRSEFDRESAGGTFLRLSALLAVSLIGVAAPSLAADAGDPARGQTLWRKCASCHTLDADRRNKAGPSLYGVFGRVAGSVPNYRYSEALKSSGVIWNEQTLDAYLKDTQSYLPGTKMYGGLTQDQDRADLLAFLRVATSPK